MPTTTLDASKKASKLMDCGASGRLNDWTGAVNQYLIPNSAMIVARADGLTPQNSAEKTSAGKNVRYGKATPAEGVSALLSSKAATVAASAAA